jgi:hypothetical protein
MNPIIVALDIDRRHRPSPSSSSERQHLSSRHFYPIFIANDSSRHFRQSSEFPPFSPQ